MAAAVSEFRPQVIDRVDSNKIYVGGEVVYEMGSYLGGGNASTVYECKAADRPDTRLAIKQVHPINYRMSRPTMIARSMVVHRGDELPREVEAGKLPLRREHVWWMYHASTKQVIPCWTDPSAGGQIRELTLPKCVEVWGWNPPQAGSPDCLSLSAAKAKFNTGADDTAAAGGGTTQSAIANVRMEVVAKRRKVVIPEVPPRFINLIFARRKVFREIAVMRRLPEHPNILQLHDVCEQVQDNRCCLHIVLELADGGELFDRIKLDQGCSEVVACDYFQQLLAGVQFCHSNGVAHRDLKPENLLLTENDRDPAYQEQEEARDLSGQNPSSTHGLAPLQPPMHGDREQTASSGMASSIRTQSTSPTGHSH